MGGMFVRKQDDNFLFPYSAFHQYQRLKVANQIQEILRRDAKVLVEFTLKRSRTHAPKHGQRPGIVLQISRPLRPIFAKQDFEHETILHPLVLHPQRQFAQQIEKIFSRWNRTRTDRFKTRREAAKENVTVTDNLGRRERSGRARDIEKRFHKSNDGCSGAL